jgi:hypothetical protein
LRPPRNDIILRLSPADDGREGYPSVFAIRNKSRFAADPLKPGGGTMGIVKHLPKQEIEFPSLFTDAELDSQPSLQKENSVFQKRAEDYHPLPIIEEKFPRIAEIIKGTWGTPELDNYFDKLLIDKRGDRAGFPPEVVQAMLTLSQQHIQTFGFRTLSDCWTVDPKTHRPK